MINKTAIGGLNDGKRGKEIKTFPEQYEINLRRMISNHVTNVPQVIGETILMVNDLDKLIFDIMEFHENKTSKK